MQQTARTKESKTRARQWVVESRESQANLGFFLGLLVVAVFVLPLTSAVEKHFNGYVEVCYAILLVSGVAIAWGQGKFFYWACGIGGMSIVIRWAAWHYRFLYMAREIAMLASIATMILVLLDQVFRKGPVTWKRIMGALAVYLLFGLGWAHAYTITNTSYPGSFTAQGPLGPVSSWVYYSFITLTTVGYGDIVPVGRVARMLAMGEALTGQIYLTVLIARLVALQVSSTSPGDTSA